MYASGENQVRKFVFKIKGLPLISIQAFIELYTQILDHGGNSFGALLRHVRDKPNEGCLFHCTAGKDRTGLMAAILLKVDIFFVSRQLLT